MCDTKSQKASDITRIPGIGPKLAEKLLMLGYNNISDLKGHDPEEMYLRLCSVTGEQIDRCVLYVFRLAVYFATNTDHDKELLKWWNWKDKP